MASLKRRQLRERRGWTDAHRRQLLNGPGFFPDQGFGREDHDRYPLDLAAVREAWGELRDELLPAYIRDNPGHRPWAWWQLDASEPRLRTDGGLPPWDNPGHWWHWPATEERRRRLSFGKPAIMGSSTPPGTTREQVRRSTRLRKLMYDDFEAEWESEFAYLDCIGKLTDAERETLHCPLVAGLPAAPAVEPGAAVGPGDNEDTH